MKKWWYFVFIILAWVFAIPALCFLLLLGIFSLLPNGLELGILPVIAGLGFLIVIIWGIGFVVNTTLVIRHKRKYALELSTQKNLSIIFFILALLSPLIFPIVNIIHSNLIWKRVEQDSKEEFKEIEQREKITENKKNERLEQAYINLKNAIEGIHTIVDVQKSEIEHGNYLMTITLENGMRFYIVYWMTADVLVKYPQAVLDGQTFSKLDKLVGKKFTFTFYDKETFERILSGTGKWDILSNEVQEYSFSPVQILVPKEARSTDY